VLVLT
jgi:hypothetical protein